MNVAAGKTDRLKRRPGSGHRPALVRVVAARPGVNLRRAGRPDASRTRSRRRPVSESGGRAKGHVASGRACSSPSASSGRRKS
jgi:hypothetical protein